MVSNQLTHAWQYQYLTSMNGIKPVNSYLTVPIVLQVSKVSNQLTHTWQYPYLTSMNGIKPVNSYLTVPMFDQHERMVSNQSTYNWPYQYLTNMNGIKPINSYLTVPIVWPVWMVSNQLTPQAPAELKLLTRRMAASADFLTSFRVD